MAGQSDHYQIKYPDASDYIHDLPALMQDNASILDNALSNTSATVTYGTYRELYQSIDYINQHNNVRDGSISVVTSDTPVLNGLYMWYGQTWHPIGTRDITSDIRDTTGTWFKLPYYRGYFDGNRLVIYCTVRRANQTWTDSSTSAETLMALPKYLRADVSHNCGFDPRTGTTLFVNNNQRIAITLDSRVAALGGFPKDTTVDYVLDVPATIDYTLPN